MMMTRIFQGAAFVFLCALSPLANAYIGPGAGLSAIGSVLAFIGACLLVIVGFVWYPVKRLLNRNKTSEDEQEVAGEEQTETTQLIEEKES